MKRLACSKICKVLFCLLILYLVFVLAAFAFAHGKAKPVSNQAKERFSQTQYYGDGTSGPDRIVLIEDTTDAFGVRLELIEHAEHSLDIVYHAIQAGESTSAFFGEVIKAADRGVSVRILIDGKIGGMDLATRKLVGALNEHENIECRQYNPIRILKPWEWNTLLHDKFLLVDENLLLLGGRNLGVRYYDPKDYSGEVVHDRDVLVWNTGDYEKSVLFQVAAYMEELWWYPQTDELGKLKPKKSAVYCQNLLENSELFKERNPMYYKKSLEEYKENMVPTRNITLLKNPICVGQKEPWIAYQLRELSLQSKELVMVQTPYATGNKYLLDALSQISDGVDVTMLINSMASSPNYPAFSNYHFNRKKFIQTDISIYEYQGSHSIHGKSMIFDGQLSAVGSFNLDDRSMYIDTETMLVIDSPEFAQVLTDAIQQYMDNSLQIDKDNQYKQDNEAIPAEVSLAKKGVMFLFSLISRPFQFLF